MRVDTGMPQLLGTQFWVEDGALVPRPIENPEGLAARREDAGLISMEEDTRHVKRHDDRRAPR